jgi:Class III cytochrome C family/Cytochrome c3
MKPSRRYLTMAVLLFVVESSLVLGQTPHTGDMDKLDCLKCHTCEKPTKQDMCLKACPTLMPAHKTSSHKLKEAPAVLVLKSISNQYGPVNFNHKKHAAMSEMGENCALCHHYSPEGEIPKCEQCHAPATDETNLRMPSLKAAYHRHCLSCHREWSHDTKCEVCHQPIVDGKVQAAKMDPTDIMGISHPKITIPTTKLYTTDFEDGPLVTFHHEEHVDRFGLQCVDCHRKENCSNCHEYNGSGMVKHARTVAHENCYDCHDGDKCGKCHGKSEKGVFSHAVVGWPLSRFHAKLSCRACHPTGKPIEKLDKNCISCHSGWTNLTFDHSVNGLILNETHRQFGCESCHIESRFDRPPSCLECHDESYDYKVTPPGEFIEQ